MYTALRQEVIVPSQHQVSDVFRIRHDAEYKQLIFGAADIIATPNSNHLRKSLRSHRQVQVSDCREKEGEAQAETPKAEICPTAKFATFPARSRHEHLNHLFVNVSKQGQESFKNCKPQTGAKRDTYEVSVSNPQSVALLSGTELANILGGNMPGNKSESYDASTCFLCRNWNLWVFLKLMGSHFSRDGSLQPMS